MSQTSSEQKFLKQYDAAKYPRPSVTADIAIFTLSSDNKLNLLLIRRGGHPYQNYWALPGGFLMAGQESAEQAAARELEEETGVTGVYLEQLRTFSAPDRDPRTHVISVAYTALIPKGHLAFQAGDDAKDARLFQIEYDGDLCLTSDDIHITAGDLAFDHAEIIQTAIIRLRGRIDYMPDAFELLHDKRAFTIHELKCAYEAILGRRLDTPNFRKMFHRVYVKTGFAAATGITKAAPGAKPAMLYRISQKGDQP